MKITTAFFVWLDEERKREREREREEEEEEGGGRRIILGLMDMKWNKEEQVRL